MENKTNTILIILVTIFATLTVVLSGYIIYDKFFKTTTLPKTEENSSKKDNEKETTTKKKLENTITSINAFPEINDNNIKEYNINKIINDENVLSPTNNFSFAIEGIKFQAKCTYSEDVTGDDIEECLEADLFIEQRKTISIDFEHNNALAIITDDYIIIQSGMSFITPGNIDIYDKSGNIVKSIENTNKGYSKAVGEEEHKTAMKIQNNKLYYITSKTAEENLYDISFNYLDIKTMQEHTIEEFQGFTNQQD